MSSQPLSTSPELQSQLRLISFVWDRGNQRDAIEFVQGFNLLGDRTQAERTAILRLIRYAMGGSESRIENDIMRATKEVRLEFLANESHVSTVRSFEHPKGKFRVVVDESRYLSLDPDEMGVFLLDLLGIPKIHYQRGEARLALLSFNDLARLFVVDRDFSYTEILSKMYPEPRKEAVKLMLGLTTQEIADTEDELRKAEGKVRRLTEEIRGVERLLTDFSVGSLIEIEQRRNALLEVLEATQDEERALRQKIEHDVQNGSQVGHAATEFEALREQFLTKRERYGGVQSELAALVRQIGEKTNLKTLLESEARKLERHSTSQYVISTFTFSRCPRCLQSVDTDMRHKEDVGKCMLCGRELQESGSPNDARWGKVRRDANKAVEEADQLLDYYAARQKQLGEERDELAGQIELLQGELARQTATYVSPLVEDLSLINERRTSLYRALSELDLEEKQRRYAQNLSDQVLPSLKSNLDKLQGNLEELRLRRGRSGDRFEALLTQFRYFMRNTASGQFQSCSWDNEEMLPRINEQMHTKAMTGFDLAISVLAFHYALLAMKVQIPRFATAHPGLLIVDEPQQQMMEEYQYQKIMQLLSQIGTEYSEQVQVIVAATNVRQFEDFLRPIPHQRI